MDAANCQIGPHAMQTSQYIRGGTRPENQMAIRSPGVGHGERKHGLYLKKFLNCSYCYGDTHTVEYCYYINGFPVGHKLHGKNVKPKNKRPTAYTVYRDSTLVHDSKPNESPTFTTEEYNQLITLLNNQFDNFSRANATGTLTPTCNLS